MASLYVFGGRLLDVATTALAGWIVASTFNATFNQLAAVVVAICIWRVGWHIGWDMEWKGNDMQDEQSAAD